MAAMFGHRWTSSFGESIDPDGVWRRCLEGVDRFDLAYGLEAVAKSGAEWPPTAPQFREMCLQRNACGLPTADEAYFEALSYERQSPSDRDLATMSDAAYHTWRNMDLHNWRLMPMDRHAKAFKAEYTNTLEHVRRGGVLAESPRAMLGNSAETREPTAKDRAAAKAQAGQARAEILKFIQGSN